MAKSKPRRKPFRNIMNLSRCPHCGTKLGNFLYADACPRCHEELKQNTLRLSAALGKDPGKRDAWPVRLFFRVMRFVEQ